MVEDAQWGDRALGLMLWGKAPGEFNWYAGASNPDWAPDGDLEANGVDALARVEWEPSERSRSASTAATSSRVRARLTTEHQRRRRRRALHTGGLDLLVDALARAAADRGHGRRHAAGLRRWCVRAATTCALRCAVGAAAGAARRVRRRGRRLLAERSGARGRRRSTCCGATALRVMPQVELVRPLGTPSAQNPWQSSEAYYVMRRRAAVKLRQAETRVERSGSQVLAGSLARCRALVPARRVARDLVCVQRLRALRRGAPRRARRPSRSPRAVPHRALRPAAA